MSQFFEKNFCEACGLGIEAWGVRCEVCSLMLGDCLLALFIMLYFFFLIFELAQIVIYF
jgi:hypothetical protein